ncbi:glycoside hydrolase family 15 protein [Arthrobacter sp. Soil782]|uniref:glycoside hydrolase family 15 protein n=1 Tax=Arthrobacter sp. Soil782 TaxID=1736410 RepID=UPI003FA439F7
MSDQRADRPMEATKSTPLEEYAFLSDLRTGALVSRDGSIDWLCFPRFDSPSVFAALLGTPEDGRWKMSVVDGEVSERRYRPRTFVLETTWRTPTGTVVVTDFMPPDDGQSDLIRQAHCTEGTVQLEHDLRIRFDYNRSKPWTRRVKIDESEQDGLLSIAGPNALLLTGPLLRSHPEQRADPVAETGQPECPPDKGHPGHFQGGVSDRFTGTFSMGAGDVLSWALLWHESHRYPPRPVDPAKALQLTSDYWTQWSSRVDVHDREHELVLRSLMVLRGLTVQETGGIVAAATTSLPEEFGGVRNWDYRYTWLRDAALTIETLITQDFTEGATHWRDWLLRAVAGDPEELQIMYGVGGERQLPEWELNHLAGYEGSRPVRIGNEAAKQYQADVVGEVMLALAALREAGIPDDESSWGLQKNLLRFCERNMNRKGHGIWEMRGTPAFFVHGRAMMWAAFDQGIRAVENHGLDGPLDQWRALRRTLREEILEHGVDERTGSFTQTYENTEVDASLLQLPHTGIVGYDDPRILATVARIEQELRGDHGFVYRYRTETDVDGLPGGEYPFLVCSFWLVEQYAYSGRKDDAAALLERLTDCATDLGLYSEEYDPTSGRLAGNFPQAFSHLGFVRAVNAVEEATGNQRLSKRDRRPGTDPARDERGE